MSILSKTTRPGLRLFVICAAVIGTLFLGGCFPLDIEDDGTQAKLQRTEEKLQAIYSGVVGVYKGVISIPNRSDKLEASFVFYTVKINDGVDSNNAPKSHTELRAQLRFAQVGEYDDHVFKADFKEQTGDVFLTQISENGPPAPGAPKEAVCPVGPKDSSLQARGRILNGQLNGDLISVGKIGSFRMDRMTSQADVPVRDQAERLMRAFQKISGSYDGAIGSADEPLSARVVLRVEQVSSGPGLKCPELMGFFRYTQAVGEVNDSSFKVTYRESTGELLFNYHGNPAAGACSVGPTDTELQIDGVLTDNRFSGSMSGARGDFGRVLLRKVSESTEVPNDQVERLRKGYEPLVGTYGGLFTSAHDAKDTFPIKIVVNLVVSPVSPFLSCPALNALYVRPDMSDPSIGSMLLRADFYPRRGRLVLKSETPPGSTGQPGHRDLTIDANWTSSGFSGPMTWWNRMGAMQVQRCSGTTVSPKGKCQK